MPALSWFSKALLPWYDAHRRDLPWRRTRDPYRIWLSEVILQQTRVDQGLAYYERFVERFPTVDHLARAREDQVLKLWQGLGYYSRARNLHATARQVVKDHRGAFPNDPDRLLDLKGIGDYTAAAIASIAFDQPHAVVDGNVYRVLSRVFGIGLPTDSMEGRRSFRALAASLIDHHRPGDHNQAVMELGATVCTPKQPDCIHCPLRSRCVARKEDRISQLPVKSKRQAVRIRHFNYLWIEQGGLLRITKRGAGDIWHGLHELPLIETRGRGSITALQKSLARITGHPGGGWSISKAGQPIHHVLSHQRIIAALWKVGPGGQHRMPKEWRPVAREQVRKLALHRLMEKLLQQRSSPVGSVTS